MLKRFLDTIHSKGLFQKNDKLIIAASGGLDSTVLCELCHQGGFHFEIAHCNFQLRGEESDRDEEFTKTLAKKYGVPILVKKFDTEKYATEKKISIQEAARELRYQWFEELAQTPNSQPSTLNPQPSTLNSQPSTLNPQPQAPNNPPSGSVFILTAHHRDDNIETLLMNFFRGTGLRGLTGIPVKNDRIRRPLLDFYREELESYAKEQGLEWVEDSSNLSSKYTRNFFRNEMLPAIEKIFPGVRQNLGNNIERFGEIEKLYRLGTGEIRKKLMRQKGNEWHVPVLQLIRFNNRALVYEIISDFGFNEKQVDEVLKLAESGSGKYLLSQDQQYRIIRHRHWFIISPAVSGKSENIMIEKDCREIGFEGGGLELKVSGTKDTGISKDPATAHVNSDLVSFPLLLRKWKTGDYFYPLGMMKKKKLSRFFIDQKLSKSQKEKIWVLENGDQRIIWVVGLRIDERFKVTDKTGKILEVNFKMRS